MSKMDKKPEPVDDATVAPPPTAEELEAEQRARAAAQNELAACREALTPLAAIRAPDPALDPVHGSVPNRYVIHRCGQQAVITAADIERAVACICIPQTPLAECRAALRPLAQLPQDFRVEDAAQTIYSFPGPAGVMVNITNGQIRAARALAGME